MKERLDLTLKFILLAAFIDVGNFIFRFKTKLLQLHSGNFGGCIYKSMKKIFEEGVWYLFKKWVTIKTQ